MSNDTVVSLAAPARVCDPLTDLLRTGARRLIEAAVTAEFVDARSHGATRHPRAVSGTRPERAQVLHQSTVENPGRVHLSLMDACSLNQPSRPEPGQSLRKGGRDAPIPRAPRLSHCRPYPPRNEGDRGGTSPRMRRASALHAVGHLFHRQRAGAFQVSSGPGRHVVGASHVRLEIHQAVFEIAAVVVRRTVEQVAFRVVHPRRYGSYKVPAPACEPFRSIR